MQSNTKKILAWVFIPLAVIVILLIIANPILENILKKKLDKSLKGNIEFNYEKLDVNIFDQSIKINNVDWQKIEAKDTLHSGSVETLNFTDIDIFSYLFGETNLSIENIIIQNAAINLFPQPKDTSKKATKAPYEMIKKRLNEISIGQFLLKNLNLNIYNKDKKTKSEIEGIILDVKNFLLNSETAKKHNGGYTIGQYDVHIDNSALLMSKGLHEIRTGKISTSYKDKTFTVDSIQIVPLYAKNELAGVYGYQTNWMDVVIGELKVSEVDYDLLMLDQKINAANAQISGLRYKSFREKEYAYHPNRHTKLPHLSFKNLEIPITIDKVNIEDAHFQYEEHVPPANENGVVYFNNTNIEIKNLSNTTNDTIGLHASAKLLNKAKLTVDATFPMDNESGMHNVKGNLSSMDMTALNPVFEPLAFFSIESGILHSLYFNFNADTTSSEGDVKFNYDNLEIQLVNKRNLERTGTLKEVASFLANAVVIDSDNTNGDDGKRVSSGEISYQRDTQKSILNYWWKSLFSGMKSTAVNVESAIPKK